MKLPTTMTALAACVLLASGCAQTVTPERTLADARFSQFAAQLPAENQQLKEAYDAINASYETERWMLHHGWHAIYDNRGYEAQVVGNTIYVEPTSHLEKDR